MPKTSETPEEPQQGPPPIEEGPKQRPTRAESTPGGVGAPLGTETYEVQPLPALDAILQTNFMEDLGVKGLTSLLSHAETHMAGGYDEVHSLDTLSVYDFILMRAGHEDDQGVRRQDEITAPSVPKTIVPQGGGYVEKDAPLVRLESDESTDPQRVRVDLAPVQGSTASAAFLNFSSDQSVDAKHAEMGFYGLVSVAAGVAGAFYLYTYAGSIHSATPHNHAIWINPYNHEIELPNHSNGFRIANVTDPILAQDAATKAYVDALSYAGHTLLDASLHTDTLAAGVTDGSIVIGNVTPKWSELVISIPAANVRNVLGVDNGELRPSWKAALDATNPVNAGGAAAPGTSLIFSHRDHVHAVAASHSGSAHHAAVTLAADAQELLNLSTQELGFVTKAANLVFAGPAAGGAADPTFRSLVDADIPGAIARDAELHDILTIGADAAHSLAAQVLSAVLAANGQTGHMSGAMFDKLAGIEATADVTDAANVAGAGAVMDSDVAPGEGFLRKTGAGTYTAHKSNLGAAVAPGVNDDTAAGYSVGSVWIDTTNDDMHICVDATNGAAVWLHLNAAAAAHDHTAADGSGVLTNDEHDGYSQYDEIAAPAAPAANKGRLYVRSFSNLAQLFYVDESGYAHLLAAPWENVDLGDDWPVSVTGSGAITFQQSRRLSLSSGVNAGSTAYARSGEVSGISTGVDGNVIDWAQRVLVNLKFSIRTNTATGVVRFTLGKDVADGLGALDNRGVGIQVEQLSLKGHVHDGVGATTTAQLALLTANQAYRLLVVSDGAGNVEWFLDGVSIGVDANGPSAAGAAGECVFQADVANGGNAAVQSFVLHALQVAAW